MNSTIIWVLSHLAGAAKENDGSYNDAVAALEVALLASSTAYKRWIGELNAIDAARNVFQNVADNGAYKKAKRAYRVALKSCSKAKEAVVAADAARSVARRAAISLRRTADETADAVTTAGASAVMTMMHRLPA